MRPERRVRRQGLRGADVEHRRAKMAAVQRGDEVGLDHMPAARGVHDAGAARQHREPARIEELRQISVVPVSLDAPIGSDEDSATWGDNVGFDDEGNSPADQALRRQLIEAISAELEHLPERDRRIIERRFGIHTGEPQTLDDVAKQEGVTRERIRQIEQKTLARLRHPNNSRRLRAYLDD